MKTQKLTLMIATVLMSLSAAAAGGARAVEVKSVEETKTKFETDMKAGAAELKGAKGEARDALITSTVKALDSMTNGQANSRDLTAALSAKLAVNEGGKARNLDMAKIAKSIADAAKTRENTESTDAKVKELLDAKKEALELAPKFLALASVVSKSGGTADAALNGFAKQMSLIPEMLSSMDVQAIKAHNEIMALAVDAKMKNPEIEGDQAFVQALKGKFSDKADQKLADLNGCQRSFAL